MTDIAEVNITLNENEAEFQVTATVSVADPAVVQAFTDGLNTLAITRQEVADTKQQVDGVVAATNLAKNKAEAAQTAAEQRALEALSSANIATEKARLAASDANTSAGYVSSINAISNSVHQLDNLIRSRQESVQSNADYTASILQQVSSLYDAVEGLVDTADTYRSEASFAAREAITAANEAAFIYGGIDYVEHAVSRAENLNTEMDVWVQRAKVHADRAEVLKEETETYYNDYVKSYYKSLDADPTEDIFGDPVKTGAWYFNTVDEEVRVYDGTQWISYSDFVRLATTTVTGILRLSTEPEAHDGLDDNTAISPATLKAVNDLKVDKAQIVAEFGADAEKIVNQDEVTKRFLSNESIQNDLSLNKFDKVGGHITGSITVSGDLNVAGTMNTVNAVTVEVDDNTIVLNKGEVGAGVTAGTAGIRIDRGTSADYLISFDEVSSNFRIGEDGNLQAVATREDNPLDTGIAVWDSTTNKFTASRSIDVDSVNGRDITVDGAKLDTIETGATADQTAEEIETLYESLPDTNKFTDTDKSFLSSNVSLDTVATTLPEGVNELHNELDSVVDGTTDIVFDNTVSGLSALTVKAAIDEVKNDVDNNSANIGNMELDTTATDLTAAVNEVLEQSSNHINDTENAHQASAISYSNSTSGITAVDVQSALDEILEDMRTTAVVNYNELQSNAIAMAIALG